MKANFTHELNEQDTAQRWPALFCDISVMGDSPNGIPLVDLTDSPERPSDEPGAKRPRLSAEAKLKEALEYHGIGKDWPSELPYSSPPAPLGSVSARAHNSESLSVCADMSRAFTASRPISVV